MLGNGKVNFDTFFLAANETNFFIKIMQLRGYNTPPLLDLDHEIETNQLMLATD